ncbi:cell wall hydrolase [Sphingosinicella sp. CPCC 101087]|uniref:cell wall hydrolase n=1 Tax=Sphingosinicella sp. CPCC 101087 TaxID=2497754 RepID=UPI00101D3079|nr:cell wall hydrolase [Sphingosinicella sp. CPCC 101087]
MALSESTRGIGRDGKPERVWRWALLALVPTSISCVPVENGRAPTAPSAVSPATAPETEAPDPAAALLMGRTRSILAALARGGDASAFRGRSPVDQLRSLDCLAQAIYYEAASESEDGQRAVAQVVLNRVRHPAWPNSVCGVVYQGPMRAGGGCQFTFTCDGSLTRPAGGIAWARARALAAEALAGRVYAPAGSSTHYHTHAVSPSWAPRLQPTLSIGAHAFYRLPGAAGEGSAFTANYAGREPLPQPSMILVRPAATASAPAFAALPEVPPPAAAAPAPISLPSDLALASSPPESTVREEYRSSGQWRDDAPAAITGR